MYICITGTMPQAGCDSLIAVLKPMGSYVLQFKKAAFFWQLESPPN